MWNFGPAVVCILATGSALASARAPISYPDNSPPPGVDVWCGKAYREINAPFDYLVERGWLHPPSRSDVPLFEFTCRPRLKPYVAGINDKATIIVEANISYDIGEPFPGSGLPSTVYVSASSGGAGLAAHVPVKLGDGTKQIEINLSKLSPGSKPYEILCSAAIKPYGRSFAVADAQLDYLVPNPFRGASTAQLDSHTDRFVISGLSSDSALPTVFYPIGYYTSWDGYLRTNYSRLQDIKDAGYTIVHPIPGGGSAEAAWGSLDEFVSFLDAAEKVGMWVMYDMRHTYRDSAELSKQIIRLRSHPAILLWYTADEPDGHNDPTDSTLIAYNIVSSLDGYHPISQTPNCQNYFWLQYASGADIIVPDVYPIGNNVTFSDVYHTPCNRTYGCCGCDNCPGTIRDLGNRIKEMKEFARWTGIHRTFWGVGQAFGEAEFWRRLPTTQEMVEQSRLAIDAGAAGMLYWSAPAREHIWEGTSRVARLMNPTEKGQSHTEL